MKSTSTATFDEAYQKPFCFDKKTSVVDPQHMERLGAFDLVICQGMLPYLNPADLRRALHNLGQLSHGALYLEAVSREDWEQGMLDEDLTDPSLCRHRAALYRRGLDESFTPLGGGLWLSRQTEVPLFALETLRRG